MVGALALAAALSGPAAYTLDTAATAYTGAISLAGPTQASATGFVGTGNRSGAGTAPRAGAGTQTVQGQAPSRPYWGACGGWGHPNAAPGGTRGRTGLWSLDPVQAAPRAGCSTPVPRMLSLRSRYKPMLPVTPRGRHRRFGPRVRLPIGHRGPGDGDRQFNGTQAVPPMLAQVKLDVAEANIRCFIAGGGKGVGQLSRLRMRVRSHLGKGNFTASTVGGVTVCNLAGGAPSQGNLKASAREMGLGGKPALIDALMTLEQASSRTWPVAVTTRADGTTVAPWLGSSENAA